FDDQILCLYAKGMTTREIVAAFKEMYGAEVSPTLISKVTEAVIEQVIEWQSRPLDRKSTRLNSSHVKISYAVFCLKKKKHYLDEEGLFNERRYRHANEQWDACWLRRVEHDAILYEGIIQQTPLIHHWPNKAHRRLR